MLDGAGRALRLGRVVVTDEEGTVFFTGYLTREPKAMYAGADARGAVYRWSLEATSDEWILDRQGVHVGAESFAMSGDSLLASLTSRVGGGLLSTSATGTISHVGHVRISSNTSWSENAALIAKAAGASYRALSGEIQIMPLGAVSHALMTEDDTLTEADLHVAMARDLVNDVAVSGPLEAGTPVTEVFMGDGATAEFVLAAAPHSGGPARSAVIVSDAFQTAPLDTQRWSVAGSGSYLGVGAGGLLLMGGDGFDGSTTLTAASAVELGGVLLLEADAVTLNQGSDGVLLGLYSGPTSRTNCVVGFDVRQSNGVTMLGCLLDGVSVGATMPLETGHQYSLRLHLHAAEQQRVRQSYVVMVAGAPQTFGGESVDSPLDAVFEVHDLGMASNSPSQVLYSGQIESSPANASFVPVNSARLQGTIGALTAKRAGSVWMRSWTAAGGFTARLPGTTGTGADYTMASSGTVRFYPGQVPVANEQIVVQYRRSQRSVARKVAAESVTAEARGGLPGMASWRGSVPEPAGQSSEDCAAAAAAILAVASSRAEAVAGSYTGVGLSAVWPGDLLRLTSEQGDCAAIVRRVVLTDAASAPESEQATIEFANDWAQSATLTLSKAFAADAVIPETTSEGAAPAVLTGLTVVSVTSSTLQLDTGVEAPAAGGFEVRRFDGGFGAGEGGDLVLRSSARSITLPRQAQIERFYVRPYDGSTPPVYARLSSAVMLNVPVS